MKEHLWVEKYRPKTLEELILPSETLKLLSGLMEQDDLPNLHFYGGAGTGKTSVAHVLLNHFGFEVLELNGSLHGNIDTLRFEITEFATSMALNDKRKFVFIDEADHLNPNSTQPALRNFIEEYSSNCGFIFTSNHPVKIIPELHSRLVGVDFSIPSSEKKELMKKQALAAAKVLRQEGIEFEKKPLQALIVNNFPDFRKSLNTLQGYSAKGIIDAGVVSMYSLADIEEVMEMLKHKKFTDLRTWVADNGDIDGQFFYRSLYDLGNKRMDASSAAQMVITLGEYQEKHSRVADKEINMMACLTEIMSSCVIK